MTGYTIFIICSAGIKSLNVKTTGIIGMTGTDSMNTQNRKIFSAIQYKNFNSHHFFKIFGIRIAIKYKSDFKYPYKEAAELGITSKKRSQKLIVSLTSHPPRIHTASIAINTLLKQSLKPDKVILWLAESQFPQKEKDLPEDLLRLINFGLEIKWCKDLKSYKKLVPALKEYPNDVIVTADDDLYYPETWLSNLYSVYLKNPQYIHAVRVVKMKIVKNSIVAYKAYEEQLLDFSEPSLFNQTMTGAGCLFPPNCLHEDIFDTNNFLYLVPTHDDIYTWIMAVLKNTKIRVVNGYNAPIMVIENTEKSGLCKINNIHGAGIEPEEAFKRMIKKYPQVLSILRNEK